MYKLPIDTTKECSIYTLTFHLWSSPTTSLANTEHEELWANKGNIYFAAYRYTHVIKLAPSYGKQSRDAHTLLLMLCKHKVETKQAQAMAQMLLNQIRRQLT
jgi:hypothetical protein